MNSNRGFHDFHHPLWDCFPLFLETPILFTVTKYLVVYLLFSPSLVTYLHDFPSRKGVNPSSQSMLWKWCCVWTWPKRWSSWTLVWSKKDGPLLDCETLLKIRKYAGVSWNLHMNIQHLFAFHWGVWWGSLIWVDITRTMQRFGVLWVRSRERSNGNQSWRDGHKTFVCSWFMIMYTMWMGM